MLLLQLRQRFCESALPVLVGLQSASVLRALENPLATAQVAAASVNTKRREMRRLALAAVAGQWAVEAGVLPHTADEVLDAVRCVRDAWLGAQVFESQADRAVTNVRDYVSRHRGGMADTAAYRGRPMLPTNCRGILHDGHVLLTKSNFVDACGGFDIESVARALKEAGILHTNEPRHFTVKTSIAALGITSARYYKLSFERLYGDDGGVQSDEEVTADADVGSAM